MAGNESPLSRTRQLLEEGGVWHTFCWGVQKASKPLLEFGTVVFFRRTLEEEPPRPIAAVPVTVRQILPSDFIELQHDWPGNPLAAEELQRRLQLGDCCLAAFAPDARWVTRVRATIPELGKDFVLARDEAYCYGGYTRVEMRRCGVDAMVRSHVFRTLRAGGVSKVYSYVRGDNPGGLRAAQRWLQRIGTLRYVGLPNGRRWVMETGGQELPTLSSHEGEEAEALERFSGVP